MLGHHTAHRDPRVIDRRLSLHFQSGASQSKLSPAQTTPGEIGNNRLLGTEADHQPPGRPSLVRAPARGIAPERDQPSRLGSLRRAETSGMSPRACNRCSASSKSSPETSGMVISGTRTLIRKVPHTPRAKVSPGNHRDPHDQQTAQPARQRPKPPGFGGRNGFVHR